MHEHHHHHYGVSPGMWLAYRMSALDRSVPPLPIRIAQYIVAGLLSIAALAGVAVYLMIAGILIYALVL